MKKSATVLMSLFAAAMAQADILDPSQFLYCAPVTFPGYTIADDTQANFPVLVRLTETEGGFSYANSSADGSDVRFTLADGTILASEVSLWNTNGESLVWVSVPQLAVGTEITLYWGGSRNFPASQTDGSVWSAAGYFAVWHMDEDSTSTIAKDSAGGAMEGTHVNTMPGQSDSKVGRSVRISNAGWNVAENKGIRTAAYSNVGSEFVFTLWAKYPNQDVGNDRLGGHKTAWDGNSGWEISGKRYDGNNLDFRGASGTSANAAVSMKNMGWSHLVFVFEADNKGTFYLNNSWKSSNGLTAATDNDVVLVLGNAASLTDVSFKGWMDEVRLHKGGMTRNWITTEYNSVNNASFAAVGAAEPLQSDEDIPVLGAVSVSSVSNHCATLSWALRTASASASATVTAYYGTDSANLSQSLVLASGADIATGAHTATLSGLTCGSDWYVKVVATGEDGNSESDVISFTTVGAPSFAEVTTSLDGLSVTIAGVLADAGSAPLAVTAHLGAATSTWTTVGSWSGVSAPRSFEATATAPSLGNYVAGFRATGTCTDCGHVFDVASAVANVTVFGECRWTGSAGDLSWNTPGNWSSGTVPGAKDTAIFGAEASVSGATIALDGAQSVGTLVVESDGALTIGSADDVTEGYALSAAHLSRTGEDAGQLTFAVPFTFSAPEDGTNTLAAGANIRFGASLGATETRPLVKTGEATVTLAAACVKPFPEFFILAGAVSPAATSSFTGNVHVGDGVTEAHFTCTVDNAAADNGVGTLTVMTNSTANVRLLNWGHCMSVFETIGGTITCSGNTMVLRSRLCGGRIRNPGASIYAHAYNGQELSTRPSGATARFEAGWAINVYGGSTFRVEDGAAPVDLVISGNLWMNGGAWQSIYKRGAGTLKLTATGGPTLNNEHAFELSEGVTLCDNASGSPLGNAKVKVNAGATLGGCGFIGGTELGDVSVSGTAAKPAVIAPGSIDEETGAHLYGTLTVGTASQTNNVAFGADSKLRLAIGPRGQADSLRVHGAIDLSGSTDSLEIIPSDTAENVNGGTYVLAYASEGITGSFDTVVQPIPNSYLSQTANEIILTLRAPTVILLR